ncbi:MAG: SDR family oxidoreductase [Methylococcales bacterium]
MSTPLSSEPDSVAIIGCGWLGTPLATTLITRGFRVVATRSTPGHVAELQGRGIYAIQLVLGPSLECGSLESLKGISTAVILLPPGTRAGCGGLFPEKISNLISALIDTGINHVIFTSSTSVYPAHNRDVDETETSPPDTETGRVLLEAEKRVLETPGIQGTIIRFAGLCGPGREPGRLLAGRSDLRGGDNPVNLIHQQDAIELLATVINHRSRGRIFNGCAPCHPAKSDLYPKAAESMGLAPPVFSRASAPFKKVRADKICRELGFVYRYPDPCSWCW